jgi:glutaredoxin
MVDLPTLRGDTMPTATITLVHGPACHFCTDAQAALGALDDDFEFRVDLVAADSERGQALVATHRPGMFPLVLVDGGFFSAGRLPRNKLRALLTNRAVPAGRR